ncbi:unnamed protein product, partial [Ixodes hexagonus]
ISLTVWTDTFKLLLQWNLTKHIQTYFIDYFSRKQMRTMPYSLIFRLVQKKDTQFDGPVHFEARTEDDIVHEFVQNAHALLL